MAKLNGEWTTEYGVGGTLDGRTIPAFDQAEAFDRAAWLRSHHHLDAHVVSRQVLRTEWQPLNEEQK